MSGIKTLLKGASKADVEAFFADARQRKAETAPAAIPAAEMARAKAEAAAQIASIFPGRVTEPTPLPNHRGLTVYDLAGRCVFRMNGEGRIEDADWPRLRAMRDQYVAGAYHPSEGMVVTLAAALVACLDLGLNGGGKP